jgi:hypothetical protein
MADSSQTTSTSGLPSHAVATITQAEVQRALDGLLAESMRSIFVGLAFFYALISIWYVSEFTSAPEPTAGVILELGRLSVQLLPGAMRALRPGCFRWACWPARSGVHATSCRPKRRTQWRRCSAAR